MEALFCLWYFDRRWCGIVPYFDEPSYAILFIAGAKAMIIRKYIQHLVHINYIDKYEFGFEVFFFLLTVLSFFYARTLEKVSYLAPEF